MLDSVDDFVERAMAFNPKRNPTLLRRSLLHNLRQLPNGKWTWKHDPNRMSMTGDFMKERLARARQMLDEVHQYILPDPDIAWRTERRLHR